MTKISVYIEYIDIGSFMLLVSNASHSVELGIASHLILSLVFCKNEKFVSTHFYPSFGNIRCSSQRWEASSRAKELDSASSYTVLGENTQFASKGSGSDNQRDHLRASGKLHEQSIRVGSFSVDVSFTRSNS